MKVIQKHPLPRSGYGSLSLPHGARIVGMGLEGEHPFVYVEQPQGAYSYVYWEVIAVREGEPFADGMQVLGIFNDPSVPVQLPGRKVFVVGRING